MIRAYQRFVNWRLVTVDGRETKQPFDPRTGLPIDPNNPNNWRTYDEIVASGHPIGFAIAAQDPFFFLDLDKCRIGDQWKSEAVAICQQFAGAAREVSQSGNGIHVIGTCDKLLTSNLRNKWDGWLEFYTTGRFVAFGPYGWEGDFSRDCTQAILQLVPRRETQAEILQSGPSPDYTGPVDDDELISKMLASRGSIASMFGGKASFDHLWHADRYADVLMQHFPSPSGDVYDRSSADAALMAHLAFWTGKDAERMDRLFRRSALVRPKYVNRPDYRTSTITGAISQCKRIYDFVRPVDDDPQAAAPAGEYLTIPEMLEYFKGCVYVTDMHRIMTPTGDLLNHAQFRAYYGGKIFAMSADGTGPTKNAFEAFTENRAHTFPKVRSTCFRPRATPGAVIEDKVNVYQPFVPEMKAGDPKPFLDHLAKLLPDTRDREILLSYCASLVQNPGVKFQWAPVIQGAEGNGKTILTICLEHAVGYKYAHRPSAEDLKNPFNSYLENKLLIAVEEVYTEGRRELLDMLKPLITNDRIETQPKRVDKRMVDNVSNWIFMTNHRDAIPKSVDGRRYAVFFTAQQDFRGIERDGMSGDYFPKLYHWLRNEDGYAIVTNYLRSYRVRDEFNPATTLHRAPQTSTTPQAIAETRGRAEQYVLEAIESGDEGFRNGWVSSYRADITLREHGIRLSPVKLGEMIRSLGYTEICRSERAIMEENLKRPKLYLRSDLADRIATVFDYCEAQGYTSIKRAPQPPVQQNVVRFPNAK